MFDKNVYKMTVVCCNYAVASYPPGNRRRAFHWRKYRRSAGDSCIANDPPENAQWNAPTGIIAMPFGAEKLKWSDYPKVKNFDAMFIRFDTTHERDRQTHTETHRQTDTA